VYSEYDIESVMFDVGALLVQQAKCALSMEKALADVKNKLGHHQQEACTLGFCCHLMLVLEICWIEARHH